MPVPHQSAAADLQKHQRQNQNPSAHACCEELNQIFAIEATTKPQYTLDSLATICSEPGMPSETPQEALNPQAGEDSSRQPRFLQHSFQPAGDSVRDASPVPSQRQYGRGDLIHLYPHLYSRAYINFRNPDDILLFRDRFDGYVFIDNKGLEYPAVVEFAPFQKISKKKLKKKDAKAGSIEDDPEYRKFLESYCADEEKICANPETLLGEIEAKTRELIARRTTPLLEYIKNRKLEKQRIREEKREERRRRELEKKRLREEEKRKRREEERRKRKEAEKQKKIAEKEIRIKLLKKPEKGDDLASETNKEKGEEADIEESKWEKSPGSGGIKSKPLEGSPKELKEKSQNDSDKEQVDLERRFREKDLERQRYRLDDGRKHRAHYEFDKFVRRNEEELKWGKGYSQDRGKKGNHNYSFTVEAVDKLGKEDKCDDMASKKERIRNKDRPAMQLYQPGARIRTHTGSTSKIYDCSGKSSEDACDRKYEVDNSTGGGSEKSEEAE
ncbi:regulator of nonsense transcripts 3A isoform X1 [Malaclemys terrapin pileata]|uniref:regulator of nonsense transcripts 3A isoform X1 n=1 Tax=Malaclemys terrapin pileata TaxID=2991368 RepID=UPI0023A79E5D|nr:regulator of nonsense transcripts 3A isoform X1 [Malaclemys terrapin pileata]